MRQNFVFIPFYHNENIVDSFAYFTIKLSDRLIFISVRYPCYLILLNKIAKTTERLILH